MYLKNLSWWWRRELTWAGVRKEDTFVLWNGFARRLGAAEFGPSPLGDI